MHRLYLLRHAEAAWGGSGSADFDRPLTSRGRKHAAALGARMRAEGHLPASVLCSSAARARQTWEALAPGLAGPVAAVLYLPELYRGDASDYMALVAAAPAPGPLLVVGHNPMMQELCHILAAGGDAGPLAALASGFPAGGMAVLDFADPLSQIAPRKGTLVMFLPPQG